MHSDFQNGSPGADRETNCQPEKGSIMSRRTLISLTASAIVGIVCIATISTDAFAYRRGVGVGRVGGYHGGVYRGGVYRGAPVRRGVAAGGAGASAGPTAAGAYRTLLSPLQFHMAAPSRHG